MKKFDCGCSITYGTACEKQGWSVHSDTATATIVIKPCALHDAAPAMLATLKHCLAFFAKDHALDHFNWGMSALRAEDIRELNELPLEIQATIAKAERRA